MPRLNRRAFLTGCGFGLASLWVPRWVSGRSLSATDPKIDRLDLYRYDVTRAVHFSFGTWKNRHHAFLRVTAGDHCGWAEVVASINQPDLDLGAWGRCLAEVKGKTIPEALAHAVASRTRPEWSWRKLELLEMALLDARGRGQGKPAIELLGLTGRNPIPGLFCILEEDPSGAREQAEVSRAHNLKSHVKVKIFGKDALDRKLVQAVRDVMGPEAHVTADANCGYDHWKDIPDLAEIMSGLHRVGLSACEDPARLDPEQWVALQAAVGDLAIIPDYPMRPAWKAIETARPGMGRIYNLHPACMGSLSGMVALGRKIQAWGHDVMIGDDSLVGPACTAWQQMAIGLGAVWVEALEKPGDSDAFTRCVESRAVERTSTGAFALKPRPGFGLSLDESRLREVTSAHVSL